MYKVEPIKKAALATKHCKAFIKPTKSNDFLMKTAVSGSPRSKSYVKPKREHQHLMNTTVSGSPHSIEQL